MSSIDKEKNRKTTSCHNIIQSLYLLQMVWKHAPGYIVSQICAAFLSGAYYIAIMYLTVAFYRLLEDGVPFRSTLILLVIWFAIILVYNVYSNWYNNIYLPVMREKLRYKIHLTVFDASKKLDLACFDNPDVYDDFVWAMNHCDATAIGVVDGIKSFIDIIISIAAAITVFIYISLPVMILTFIICILEFFLQRKSQKLGCERDEKLNSLRRKNVYYERIFSTPDYAKEVRITHVSEVIMDMYDKNLKEIQKCEVYYSKKDIIFSMPRKIIQKIVEPLGYMIIIYQVLVTHTASLAGLAIAGGAYLSLSGNFTGLFNTITDLERNGMYAERVRTFIEYKPKVRSGTHLADRLEQISFDKVSFGYTDDRVFLNIGDFTLRRGEKIALVGYNGAGKSTFIKLIMHLYDPVCGKIIYNDIDIGEYNADSYRNRIGAVFQDYQIFALPIAENVLCNIYTEDKAKTVYCALSAAAFGDRIDTLPEGIRTELTKEFYKNGVNLSGGEAQKVGIARAFARPCDLIIMDEPSAALDPISEYELNQQIYNSAKDKTFIIISHRLSTTRHVDRIYMFENGRIIEQGSHDNLMAAGGKYAQMFNLQASKYV